MNFLSPIFSPRVTCNKHSTDNYEPENLISENFLQKARGFQVYTTVKPPVDIEFELICSISLKYILINSTVGNHNCSGIEVFAKISVTDTYNSIGKCTYNAEGVIFCSSRFYSKTNLPPNIPVNYHINFLKKTLLLSNAKYFKLRIFRTNKSVPCLGFVEIWGIVSSKCSEVTLNTIELLSKKSEIHASEMNSLVPLCSTSSNHSEKKSDIPEDFLDDLTFEIMTIPMTLPSGKTVDQLTLEKHVSSEEKIGRKPGDPFTGKVFTEIMKPVLNVALKSRIDMFLLQHSSNPSFSKMGRSTRTVNYGEEQTKVTTNYIKKIKLDDDEISIDYSKFKFKHFSEENAKSCFTCNSNVQLYYLPCKHLYCRKCLNELCESLRCKLCLKDFARSDVVRHHC